MSSETPRPSVSVIIVSYNTKELTLQALGSVIHSNRNLDLELIVVDNASSDGSVEAIQIRYPQVMVLPQTTNLGFGGANNLGAARASGKYLAFFNSDLVTNETSIEPLLLYLDTHPECGIVAPKIYLGDGTTVQPVSYGSEPTLGSLLFRAQWRFASANSSDRERSVDWVTGAAFVIRKDLFDQLGGFDTNIFMYYEDVDLCRRVRDSGHSVVWLPQASLVHLGGRSSASRWERKKVYYEAQLYYMKKHHGLLSAALLRVLRAPVVVKNRLTLP